MSDRKKAQTESRCKFICNLLRCSLISQSKITNNSETMPNFAAPMIMATESRYLMLR